MVFVDPRNGMVPPFVVLFVTNKIFTGIFFEEGINSANGLDGIILAAHYTDEIIVPATVKDFPKGNQNRI